MSDQPILQQPPQRAYKSYYVNSDHWDHYTPRSGDIVISTPAKAGTTWTQRIASVLVLQDTRLPGPLMEISPWLDCLLVPLDGMLRTLDGQQHRRFIKTHLPMDALPVHSGVSYLVVGRDLRDTAVSAHHHALGLNGVIGKPPQSLAEADDVHTPEQPWVPEDIRAFWRSYFTRSAFPWESNGWPYNSPTRHLESWWGHRNEPHVLFLHYQDLLDDLDKEMRRVSHFLDIPVDEERWPDLVQACRFSDMKADQDRMYPRDFADALTAMEFFHKGRNRQWAEILTEEDMALYRAAVEPLPPDLREWLTRSQ
ncbi:sulfotransferase domain-containing protein [Streptomyces sp. ACA25]|uniref:sulfotransferase domain-containing protein n=1 Tax=Streptomyces sp. ACA25 TaxID=3022596 RepID=UPI002306E0DE|nr:sulfotransferase domain-containing protein [Streptomyces sp. ACA25]MDB1090026.1 sulfotransferase domain-containing protein [Streptomyces sp. ACA25]